MRYFLIFFSALLVTAIACGGSQKPASAATGDTTAAVQPADTTPAPTPETAATAAAAPAATRPAAPAPAAQLPKLWDFSAEWCPPCQKLKPVIAELEREYAGRIEIRTIDTDKEKELAQKFGVQAIPTLVYLDAAGKEVDRSVGLVEKSVIVDKFKSLKFIQ